jgi:hypothetical protein
MESQQNRELLPFLKVLNRKMLVLATLQATLKKQILAIGLKFKPLTT